MDSSPVTVLCIYRVKEGREEEFRRLLEKHWPTLDRLGLVSSQPASWYRGMDKKKRVCFVEMFQWKDAQAPRIAHELPEVMSVWEPMGGLLSDMEFIDVEHLGG